MMNKCMKQCISVFFPWLPESAKSTSLKLLSVAQTKSFVFESLCDHDHQIDRFHVHISLAPESHEFGVKKQNTNRTLQLK